MLPDDPLNEDPDEMETPPLDALLATPDEMMTPPDPVIPIPSLDTMAIPGATPLESGVDPNPPPQHCTVELDVTAHTPYHPQLMDVMIQRDEAAYGMAVAPRRDNPQHVTFPPERPQLKWPPAHIWVYPLDTAEGGTASSPSPPAPQHVAKGAPLRPVPQAHEWDPPHVTEVCGPIPAASAGGIPDPA